MVINGSLQFGCNKTAHWIRTMQENTDPVFLNLKLGTELGTGYKKGKKKNYKKKNPELELIKHRIVSYSNKLHLLEYPTFLSRKL